MATTTNYGWTTPDDTALVKDGAAAIRTLGSSVDTTTKALNPSTTLGDIEYRSSTANTNTRLGIGTTGQVLTVAGGVPSWATSSSGGMTLISTTTLSGATITLSSIPQTYKNLNLVIRNPITASDQQAVRFRFNSDSNANRHAQGNLIASTGEAAFNSTSVPVSTDQDNATSQTLININVFDYTNATTWKFLDFQVLGTSPVDDTNYVYITSRLGAYNQTGAITSIQLFPNSGNFTSGTVLLYGVN